MVDMYKEKNPLAVCLVGVFDENKILLVKRKRPPYEGYWGLIGGRQTFGQEFNNVVRKEVLEETGFAVHDASINGTYSEILLDKTGNPKDHFLFVVTKADLNKAVERVEEVENTDVDYFKWFNFPISEEDAKQIIPTDLIMINNFNSESIAFREFTMQEDGAKLKVVKVSE